jgi:hypothetical protein
VLALVVLVTVLWTSPLSAQIWEAGLPGDDIGSVAVTGGVVAPSTNFSDDGSHFESGGIFGLALTYWPFEHFGLRTHVMRGKTQGNHGDMAATCPPAPCSPIGFQEPVVWHYSLEAALRRPMGGSGGTAWFPFVSVGATGKSYRWSIERPWVGYTGGGWTAAGGVELRMAATGPFGFIAEARTFQTRFQALGKNQTHSDFAFTAGLTLSR